MTATVTKIVKTQSKYGGDCYLVSFKDKAEKSYRSWVYTACNNFKRWIPILTAGEGTVVSDLAVIGKNLVNADSHPKIERLAEKIQEQVKKEEVSDGLFAKEI